MVQKSQRPQALLTIPQIPSFPLSSPITEEVVTPTSTSSDDRDMERNRPFDFLSKMSNRRSFLHQTDSQGTWRKEGPEKGQAPSHRPEIQDKGPPNTASYHVGKNPERPVGLNLITDISFTAPQPHEDKAAPSFVDLNDLKLLSKAREEERSAQGIKSILKKGNSQGFHRLPDDPSEWRQNKEAASLLNVTPDSPKKAVKEELSPSDRPIMIGFSVPFHESPEFEEKSKELDSAGTQQTPLTPSIVVTPAKEDSFWTGLAPPEHHPRPRVASSIYSQPTPCLGNNSDIPPVPTIPAFRLAQNSQSKSSAFLQKLSVSSARKRRSFSTGAVTENDEVKKTTARARSHSNENTKQVPSKLSINTEMNNHASTGWWSILLSPLLSRITPTETSRPPVPAITTRSSGLTEEWWEEKEVSYFSPDTPLPAETPRNRVASWHNTNENPFADFDWSRENHAEKSGERDIASFIFSGNRIQGEAAEYYQACAHELFSGRPYFECINHVCSITPKDKIMDISHSPPLNDAQGPRSLLIDVDDTSSSTHDELRRSLAATTIADSPLDTVADRELESPNDNVKEAPQVTPPNSDNNNNNERAREAELSPEHQSEKQNTNPFLQQSSAVPPPITNVYIQPAAAQVPSHIYVQQPATQPSTIYVQQPMAQPPVNFYTQTPPVQQQMPIPMSEPEPTAPTRFRHQQHTSPPLCTMSEPNQIPPPPPRYGAQAHEPYPTSPGLQGTTVRGGSIQLTNMPSGPAPAYTLPENGSAALSSRINAAPITLEGIVHPATQRERIEHRRRRLEKEDAIGRKAGGLWRGRGPFSKTGCFGRPGREGRLRRRWYFLILLLFIMIVVGAILLAIFLTRGGDETPVQSQWLNLTGYPPMPTGISTIAGPEPKLQESGCISLPSMWSCALPKEEQSDNRPYAASSPNFRVEIRFRNGTYEHSTTLASRSDQSLIPRDTNQLFNPSPMPPSTNEQQFLGNTTDGNSSPFAGEETPFYMTILSAAPLSSTGQLSRRSTANNSSSSFPDLSSLIPSPAVDSDGTAAAVTLYPFPSSQPVRLYNRGQKDEHYGFYTYFDKSIFLSSSFPLTGQKDETAITEDANGGSSKANARVRCTWAQTRFLVQIWTNPDQSGKTILPLDTTNNSTTSTSGSASPTSTSQSSSSSSATDFTRPGSFPYPVTITLDRHGGDVTEKMLYCYGIEADQRVNSTEKKLQLEDRAFNGYIINPAPGLFSSASSDSSSDSSKSLGGYDGGVGGCGCQWANWVGTI